MLTEPQKQTLAAAIRAETTQAVIDALAIRNDVALADWCNSDSAQSAWNPALSARLLFEATDVAKFDNLTAGKRDAWKLMRDSAPLDFARNRMRRAVLDIWGATDSVAVLHACTRKATNAEAVFGGGSATENTVTALKLNWFGVLSYNDISDMLNHY